MSAVVAASCAVPGYFTPIEIGGVEYVDGGVHSPTNADLPIRLWFRHLLRQELWTLRRPGLRLGTVEPDRATLRAMGLNVMRAHRLDRIEAAAYALARRRLTETPGPGRS
ncbi:hypothetical protein Val02_50190 [Virgisporangium aliadipatigenens]|uniref:PNPLA domain-containing protein n=1 Tax=Virgisporangium aliadipatigenens TaxID=741659 RepID=A0A8J4DSQ9_9ACTN|nr:hypothetical protein Val02_50190 [Virgisporangium aliadipatigenens]